MGVWAYVAFFDIGAAAGQSEPDVDEAAKDLTAGIGRLRRFYESESSWQTLRESVRPVIDGMLREGRTALQRQERWTCRVGDVEVTLYPVPDRVGPAPTAWPYGIPEHGEPE
ncbi:hypothetical protein [Streptomyces kaempferi]|uniref:Uncharacterized protein n=1 Tax=Streptomyces kaempferi TaxID=333725 RepID=A0ABW3XK73_9ACTN